MRNLQKILALVLALMMSVSLVATAGAFSDDGDITDVYKDAVTVLNGLDVFKGYDNGATFQPKGNITRAEVAAIIYRIATGDVTDSQASIYSTYGQFTDVADGSWYSGYVNYCANAGYIKGRGNKIFDPQGQVTGYEALAMILRAVGYDKNGEFTGSNWQIRTASIANERGITKNVTSAQLGQAATRETVAEILFRSIVIPKVNFNANTLSYTEKPLNADGKKDTLGYESLKLEEVTGIVTANEYADLDNSVTLNADKTRMRVSGVDGGNYILDYGEATLLEGLDAIGEEHNAYIQNANTTSAKVLLMAKTDNNKTYETLEKVEIDTDSKFREKTGLQRSETATEHYLNFDEVKDWRSDWRIKYVISSVNTVVNTIDEVNREISRINANTNFELPTLANLNADTLARAGYALIPDGTTGRFFIEYTKEFRVDTTIGSVDRGNIEEIFNIADRLTKNDYVRGEVYVGTSSLKDISDEISYKQFVEQYINNDGDKKITKNENGNWLKVIDNDNDGQADYVLKVVYTMAQVVRASGGEYGLDTEDLSLNDGDEVNYLDDDDAVSEDTLVLDDIVYYAVIDGVPRATKAETATVKIDTVNRKDLRVTTTDSVEYVESGVHGNHVVSPDYTCGVTNMNGSATYDIYLDRGGYLALFTDSHGGDFTLIVDGWYNSTKGGIEYAVRAYNDETGRQDVVDVTRGGGMFIGRDVQWTDQVDNNDWRALKWLGNTNGTEALTNRDTATGTYGEGKLNGEGYANTNDVKTTVATLTDDGMIQPVDYTSVGSKVVRMLATKNNEIPDSSASYQAEVYTTGSSLNTTDTAYDTLLVEDAELRALSTTVYYLVYPSKNAESGFAVEKYTGYASVPSVDDGFIEDVYAVATRQDRTSTLGGRTYYTADVVVVELKSTFRGYAEQVFIYNMPEAGNRVGIESVDLIHENGENETGVKVDFALSNVRDYRVAHDVNSSIWRDTHWRPGLYYLYPTNTADLYTVQPMDANDIAQNDYVVGWSSTSDATAKTDHVSVVAFSNDVHVGGANIEIAYGEVTKAVSNVYRIGYDSKGIADLSTYKLDEGNLLSFVDERVDVTSGVNTYDYNKYDHYPYDRDNHPNACDICWNQNLILMHYTGNTANYTISFENDNSLAEDVWSNNMPSTLAWNDAADVNKNLSRDDAVSYAQFMLKCADPVNDANGLPTNVYYNARYHIDQAVKTAMAGTLEVKKNRVDSVADNLITQLKGSTPVEYTVSVNVTVDGVAVPAADVATYVTGVPTGTVAAGSTYTLTLTDAALAYDVSVDGTAHTGSTINGTANSNVTHTIALTTKAAGTQYAFTVNVTVDGVAVEAADVATYVTGVPASPVDAGSAYTLTLTDAALAYDVTVNDAAYTESTITGTVDSDVTINIALTTKTVVEDEYEVTVNVTATLGFDTYTGTITKSTADGKVLTLTAGEILGALKEIQDLGSTIVSKCEVAIGGTVGTSWTYNDPGAAMDLNADIRIQINPGDDPFVPDTNRAARSAARAGTDVTEQSGKFYFVVESDEEIDWANSVTLGVKCEKNNDPSNVNRVPNSDPTKTTLIFPATVAVRDGNISYIFQMVTKKIDTVAKTVAVTVKDGDTALAGATSDAVVIEAGKPVAVTVTLPNALAEDLTVGIEAPAGVTAVPEIDETRTVITITVSADEVTENITLTIFSKTPETHDITVVVANPLPTSATLTLGEDDKQSYRVEGVVENSKLEILAKANTGFAPYIVGNNTVVFTENETEKGTWTASVAVTAGVQVIRVSAERFIPVTVTQGKDVKIDNVTVDKNNKATLNAFEYETTDNGTTVTKNGPAVLLVTVPEGTAPRLSGLQGTVDSTPNTNLTIGTNYTVSYTLVDEETNQWEISLTEIYDSTGISAVTAGDITISTVPTVFLSTNNSNIAFEKVENPAPNGSVTVVVYVTEGSQPKFMEGATPIAPVLVNKGHTADCPAENMVRWEATLTGIDVTKNIRVEVDGYPKLTITTAAAATAYISLVVNREAQIDAVGGTATFEIFVDPAYVPKLSETGGTVGFEAEAKRTVGGASNAQGWYRYTVTVTGITANATLELDVVQSFSVTLWHNPGDVMTITPENGARSDENKMVSFTVVTKDGWMPKIDSTEASHVNSGGTASTNLIEKVGTTGNEWSVKLGEVDQNARVQVELKQLPSVSLNGQTGGFVLGTYNKYATKVYPSNDADCTYTATFTFGLVPGYTTVDSTDITVFVGTTDVTSNCTITGPYLVGDGTDNYEFTVTLEHAASTQPNSNITVNLQAVDVHTVTVDLSGANGLITAIDGEPLEATFKSTEKAQFKVRVEPGYQIVEKGMNYTAKALGNDTWQITSRDYVTVDGMVLAPTAELYREPETKTFTISAATGVTAVTGVSPTFNATHDVPNNDEIVFDFTVDPGFIPVVTTKGASSNASVGTIQSLVYTGLDSSTPAKKSAWTCTITDVDASLDIIVDVVPSLTGNQGKDANNKDLVAYEGSPVSGITVAVKASTDATDSGGAVYEVELDSSVAYDATTKKASFVIYVKKGYTFAIDDSGSNSSAISGSVSSTTEALEGYDAKLITVTADSGDVGKTWTFTITTTGPAAATP